MNRLLFDTHVLLRWLFEPKRLSREQAKRLNRAMVEREAISISAITLVEIAMLTGERRLVLHRALDEFFSDLDANPAFRLLPVTYKVAAESGALTGLRDPADRVIVATARVHGLELLTSDQRIISSGLVRVVE